MKTTLILTEEAKRIIADASGRAEEKTSAELKVIVKRYGWSNIREKAKDLFYKYELHKTKNRNAVMILVVLVNREFLVFGDEGIHKKVPDDFWLNVRNTMQERFRRGDLTAGICVGLEMLGEQLAKYFPRVEGDVNELSDEVIHED